MRYSERRIARTWKYSTRSTSSGERWGFLLSLASSGREIRHSRSMRMIGKISMTTLHRFCVAVLSVAALFGQSGTPGSGHWEGTLQLPDKQVKIEVDLAKNDKGEWMGGINIPEQNLK